MDQKVLDFLGKEMVAALTVMLPDGSPHGAAMHFACVHEPLTIYFSTHNSAKKASAAFPAKAALVVGFSEQNWETIQFAGIIDRAEEQTAKAALLAKYPGDAQHFSPESIYLKFMPSWWRYTDFKAQPPVIIENGK